MIQIIPAQSDDLAALHSLLERCDLPRDGFAEHLGCALAAHDGDAIIGCVAIECYGDAGLLRSVAVDPAYRGRGLGADLVAAAFDLARRLGVHSLYLLTTSAPEYFPRFGFEAISRADVAPAVQQSVEFTSACPASAIVMRADVDRVLAETVHS